MTDTQENTTATIMYGSHTFRHSSSKVIVRTCPTDGGKMAFPSSAMSAVGRSTRIVAAKNGFEDHGIWSRQTLANKDGVVLALQLVVSYNGAVRTSAIKLVRLRSGANLVTVNASLSKDAGAVYSTLPAFTGRADIISVEEAEELGVVFPRVMRNVYFDEEEIEEEFSVTTLAGGEAPDKPVPVRVGRGGDSRVVLMQKTRSRRLRIKR